MNQDLYNHGVVGTLSPNPAPVAWVRNSEWLAMPTVSPTEKKIVILFRVDPGTSNFAAFNISATGGYTVDWGDGTSNSVATGVQVNKQYDFAAVSATTTSMGYKQVLITITPTIGTNNFTSINLYVKHSGTGISGYNNGHQDVIISAPTCTTFVLGASSTAVPSFGHLERIQIIASALTSYSYIFGDFYALESYSITSSATVTNLSYMFQNCGKLQSVGSLPYSTATTTSNMFYRCKALRSLGVSTITTASTQASGMFSNCSSLVYIPPITFTVSGVNCASLFSLCTKLTNVPSINWAYVNDLSNAFSTCTALTSIPPLNLPLVTTLANTFINCYNVLAIGDITSSSALTTLASTFSACYRLTSLPAISVTSNVNTIANMAINCFELTQVPAYDTSNVTSMGSAFQYCSLLSSIPVFNYTKCTNVSNMLNSCLALRKTGAIDFGTTNTNTITLSSFVQCSNSFESGIEEIGPISIPSTATSLVATNMLLNGRAIRTMSLDCTRVIAPAGITNMFSSASSLTSVILTGLKFGGITIAAALDQAALVALFTSLGTASGAQTLTVSANPGWSLLSAGDKAIATGKGWTLA